MSSPKTRIMYKQGETDEWYTPKYIIDALGPFDLDPCSPVDRPFDTARIHLTIEDDGLSRGWGGRVWLNPPYSNISDWMERLARHNNGIALIPSRTETIAFHQYVWNKATSVLFPLGRIKFLTSKTREFSEEVAKRGTTAPNFAPVLIAYSQYNSERLEQCGIKGKFIKLKG